MFKLINTLLVISFVSGCNPFSFETMFAETKEVKIEVIGKGLFEAYKAKIPSKNYNIYKEWIEPFKYIEYNPDGTPHEYYKVWCSYLVIKKINHGISVEAYGYGIKQKNYFIINEWYDYDYDIEDKNYSNVIINVTDVK